MITALMNWTGTWGSSPRSSLDIDWEWLGSGQQRGRILLDGRINRSAGSPALWLSEETLRLRTKWTFTLETHEMPDGGCTFNSQPKVYVNGRMSATTGDRAAFDNPSMECDLVIRQKVHVAGEVTTGSSRTLPQVDIVDDARNNVAVWGAFPLGGGGPWYYTVPEVTIDELNRDVPLTITVHADLKMRFEGESSISFIQGNNLSDYNCWIRVPEFSILSHGG